MVAKKTAVQQSASGRSTGSAAKDVDGEKSAHAVVANGAPKPVRTVRMDAGGSGTEGAAEAAGASPAAGAAGAKKTGGTKSAAKKTTVAASSGAATKAAAKKITAKRTAVKKSTVKKSTVKETAVRKTVAQKEAAASKVAPSKRPDEEEGPERPAAKNAAGTKAAGKKTAEKAAVARKTVARKSAAAKGGTTESTSTESTSTKSAAKKSTAKKSTAKNAGAAAAAKQTGATTVVAKKTPGTATAAQNPTAVPKARIAAVEPGELAVRPGEDPWTPEEVAEARAELQGEAIRLSTEISSSEAALVGLMRDSGDGAGDDQADTGTKNITREHEMALAANAREMLEQTERALERLDAGTYGLCENCGNPIGKARMQAFPRATLCVECKQKQERRY
ncbi:TraR/DksA C4-type zinc finger protein [Streptomyces avermitilis]